jgi:hypothetical protein
MLLSTFLIEISDEITCLISKSINYYLEMGAKICIHHTIVIKVKMPLRLILKFKFFDILQRNVHSQILAFYFKLENLLIDPSLGKIFL